MAVVESTLTYLDSEDVTQTVDGVWQTDTYNNEAADFQVTNNGIGINTFDETHTSVVSVMWLPWARILTFELDNVIAPPASSASSPGL